MWKIKLVRWGTRCDHELMPFTLKLSRKGANCTKKSSHGLPEYMMDKANELLCLGGQVPVAATVPYMDRQPVRLLVFSL